jgi:hypothetical protein
MDSQAEKSRDEERKGEGRGGERRGGDARREEKEGKGRGGKAQREREAFSRRSRMYYSIRRYLYRMVYASRGTRSDDESEEHYGVPPYHDYLGEFGRISSPPPSSILHPPSSILLFAPPTRVPS